MRASLAGLISTRTCWAKASGQGDDTMQLEMQLTRRIRAKAVMPAAAALVASVPFSPKQTRRDGGAPP